MKKIAIGEFRKRVPPENLVRLIVLTKKERHIGKFF